ISYFSILTINYKTNNMLSFHLTPIFQSRGISRPFSYLIKAGFSYHTAHRLLNGYNRNFSLDTVQKLCEVLVCEPNDLLMFTAKENSQLREDHPLNNLRDNEDETNGLHVATKNLAYKDLKEISKKVKAQSTKSPIETST